MKVGIDVDGVLANFNESYIRRVIAITGRDLFPPRPFDIPTWNYPESYGYSEHEIARVWDTIKADRIFWVALFPYPEAHAVMAHIANCIRSQKDDVYFITARPGETAKAQTERWLADKFPYLQCPVPTVLISGHKGLCAQALGLDAYIDDRWENVLSVARSHWKGASPTCRTYLMDRPWNRDYDAEAEGIIRTDSVLSLWNDVASNVATSRIQKTA